MSNDIMQPGFGDFWQWLDAQADMLAKKGEAKDAQKIKSAVKNISKEAGVGIESMGDIVATLAMPKILPLFIRYPERFVDIATIAGRHTNAAFYALNSPSLCETLDKNPKMLKDIFQNMISATSRFAIPEAVDFALYSLSNENIAIIAMKKPSQLIDAYCELISIGGMFSSSFFSILSIEDISAIFAKNPKAVVSSFTSIAKSADPEAAAIFFSLMRKPKFKALFIDDPDALVKSFYGISKPLGKDSKLVYMLLTKPRISYLLEQDPKGLIKTMADAGKTTSPYSAGFFSMLFIDEVEKAFIDNPGKLEKDYIAILSASKGSESVISLLHRQEYGEMLIKEPEKLAKSICDISKAAGSNSGSAFILLLNDRMSEMFAKDPNKTVKIIQEICQVAGDSSESVFRFLENEKIANIFVERPDRMVSLFNKVSKSAGKEKAAAFRIFGKAQFIDGFATWPDDTYERLSRIADSTAPYGQGIFAILSKEPFSKVITELVTSNEVSNVLIKLVEQFKERTPIAFRLFDNDAFLKGFISDPYRMQIVLINLEDKAPDDFEEAVGLLFDPDILPIFEDNPYEMVLSYLGGFIHNANSSFNSSPGEILDSLKKDKGVKKAFLNYCRPPAGKRDFEIMSNELMPAFEAYLKKKGK